MISHVKITSAIDEVRGDIRRPMEYEIRTLLGVSGFVCPDKLTIRYSMAEKGYVVQLTWRDGSGSVFGCTHIFDIAAPSITIRERDLIFESLAVDARVPFAEDL